MADATTAPDPLEMMTGPGGPFEIETVDVRGVTLQAYKSRQRSLRDMVVAAAGHGDKVALVQEDRRYTFAEQDARIRSVAASLAQMGVGKGDRVAIIAANSPDWVVAFWATAAMGAVSVPLNAWWKAEELEFVLEDSETKVAIVDDRRYDVIEATLDNVPSIEHVVVFGEADRGRASAFEPLATTHTDAPMPDTPIDEDDLCALLYTSGTTGKPKGSMQTHRAAVANLQNLALRNALNMMRAAASPDPAAADGPKPTPTDQLAWLAVVPLFHVTGLFVVGVAAFAVGGKLVFMPARRFDPVEAMRLIEDEKITALSGVPTIVQRILHSPEFAKFDLTTLNQVGYGGAPSTSGLVEEVAEKFPWLPGGGATTAYGLTETAGVATANWGGDFKRHPDSCGTAVPTIEIMIAGPDGDEVPNGERGEIWIKGPTVSPGYWNRPEANAVTFTDGWLHTGDIGRMDDDGFVYILDRAKDMIIRGGENIYCAEIEDVIGRHQSIDDVAVIGVPDEDFGEKVKAVVVAKPGQSADVDELRRFASEHLAEYKVPEFWEVRSEHLPRNPAGKILKSALRGQEHHFEDADDKVL